MGALVGPKLKETREYLGLTPAWVAQQTEFDAEVLQLIESSERTPTDDELDQLARIYHYPVTYFTGTTVGADPDVLVLARADKRLNDVDLAGIQRFSEFLRAYADSMQTDEG